MTLSGTPLTPGTLLVLGCRMQWTYIFQEAGQKPGEAGPPTIQVTWVQPWAPLPSRRSQGGSGVPPGMQEPPVPTPAQVGLQGTQGSCWRTVMSCPTAAGPVRDDVMPWLHAQCSVEVRRSPGSGRDADSRVWWAASWNPGANYEWHRCPKYRVIGSQSCCVAAFPRDLISCK